MANEEKQQQAQGAAEGVDAGKDAAAQVAATQTPEVNAKTSAISRRHFLAALGGVGVGALLAGTGVAHFLGDGVFAVEASGGYLLVDTKKCAGCETCMMACSLAHHGHVNRSLSRMQIKKNPLGCFPNEIGQNQCRQCANPGCVKACPTGAMHVDAQTGVRMVDERLCIGCESCVAGCYFTPSRVEWNFEEKHAQKCDLCLNTPYMEEDGGPGGCQACVKVCPVSAIKFTTELPQQDDSGYLVNLRNEHWAILGFPIDDEGKVLPIESVPPDPSIIAPEGEAVWK